MRILLKTTGDIEKVRHILDSSKLYFYRAHVEVSGKNVYVVITQLDKR
jgi:hypothetical protein